MCLVTLSTLNPSRVMNTSQKNENKRENSSGDCEFSDKPATCTHKMLAFKKDGCSAATVTHEGNKALSGVAGRIQIPVNAQQVHTDIEITKGIQGMLAG